MTDTSRHEAGGVAYQRRDKSYFENRELVRHANVWHLWALGVGAVISGHFSGWNFGFATGGWGGMLVAGIIIAIMYLGLVFCIAEMSPALPHTGAAYSFARTAMGPWGGFITGLCENVEYVVTPAVIAFFIGSYVGGIVGGDIPPYVWWVVTYIAFLVLNIFGVALSFRVTLIVTLASLAVLVVFWLSAIPNMDFSRWALNIGAGPDGAAVELPEGNGSFFPFGFSGVLATLPFAVWLFLAIEQLPLAAEESVDPKRDMPRGIIAGMLTLMVSAFMIVLLNPSVIGVGSFKLGTSGEPLLDGFRAVYGTSGAVILGLVALVGLIASFHTIVFAMGRQVYSLSPRRLFPVRPVGHARDLQDPACRHDLRRRRRPRHHDDHVVRARRRSGRLADRLGAAQHGGVRRHVLLHRAGGVASSCCARTSRISSGPTAARSAFRARS